jgi:hypothetical protein
MKRSLPNKSLNLATTVIIHLNNMSLDVSFESCARFKKKAIMPIVRINWYICHRRYWTLLPRDVGILRDFLPPTYYVGSTKRGPNRRSVAPSVELGICFVPTRDTRLLSLS